MADDRDWKSRLWWAGLWLGLASLLVMLASGPGTRFGLWDFRLGLRLLALAACGGLAAALASLGLAAAALLSGRPKGRLAPALAGLLLGAGLFLPPYLEYRKAMALPAIHDISTDTEDPPAFVDVLPLRQRAHALNPSGYGGPAVAALQEKAYPDIRPLLLDLAPAKAFDRALRVAWAMGWVVDGSDPARGRIEATATTLFFGFKDDVVIRVRPRGPGCRVDIRSVSRVGIGDVGTNARRVRRFLEAMKG